MPVSRSLESSQMVLMKHICFKQIKMLPGERNDILCIQTKFWVNYSEL